jgi:hypothetical protein
MTATEYKVGDLITDDSDGSTGFIFKILPELILPNDNVIEGPVYKVHWFGAPLFVNYANSISTETAEGIKIYRKLT